ncbi:MAG: histidine--tRNA ligase, partial [Candidatus Eisenbacteria bacterium]|nr:histidine--tRNA ligase [Candidatus Eisenbacteria bacterium]
APSKTQVFVAVFDEDSMRSACRLAGLVRRQGFRTEIAYGAQKLKRQFARADRQGIPVVLIQGPDEQKEKVVSVKRLESGDQVKIAEIDLVKYLKEILE